MLADVRNSFPTRNREKCFCDWSQVSMRFITVLQLDVYLCHVSKLPDLSLILSNNWGLIL